METLTAAPKLSWWQNVCTTLATFPLPDSSRPPPPVPVCRSAGLGQRTVNTGARESTKLHNDRAARACQRIRHEAPTREPLTNCGKLSSSPVLIGKMGTKRRPLPETAVKITRVGPGESCVQCTLTRASRPFTEEDPKAQKRRRQGWIWCETWGL